MKPYIEQAKVMAKGQVTIPQEIRDLLGLEVGDRVSFIVSGDKVIMENSSVCALKLLQDEFEKEAHNLGVYEEDEEINSNIEEEKEIEKKK